MQINIIGAGKVGQTIMRLVHASPGLSLGDVASIDADEAQRATAAIGAGTPVADFSAMQPADLWFLTVPDDRIAAVAADLAEARGAADGASMTTVAVHCSGFLSSDALGPLRALGWVAASCHPVRSFADPATAARQFPGTYCGLEGDAEAVARLTHMVAAIGGVAFGVETSGKALYHAAAVFSNNFTVVLQALALDAWEASGVDPAVARDLCATLLSGTAENVAALGPAAALTGPAARDDRAVMDKQEGVVRDWNAEAADLYHAMSVIAGRLKRSGKAVSGV